MGRLHRPVFQQNTIYVDMSELYVDFKAQRNALYHCHGNGVLKENVIREIYDGYF